ncbi:MAG: protoheme IX farnesyltransferase [Porticoccaceae bacterium]|nr:protoheme IX farnesyltransferase [Porticoccaceae bacterium]
MTNTASSSRPLWKDYLELTKPRVVALMILTSLIGMLLAVPGMVPLDVLIFGNLGIALVAGSAAAVNHYVDRRIDVHMARTQNRPLATGRLSSAEALGFAAVLGIIGTAILVVFANVLTALLTIAALVGYAVIYTLYLKRATPQNIVIGGLAGAAPPLLGWVAVTGEVHPYSLLLVLIIFAWTPPHFWALAVHRQEDYAKAEIPMLPVTHGEKYTVFNILLYTLLLLVVSLLPYVFGMFGWIYLVGALLLGSRFLYWAIVMIMGKKQGSGMKTFQYSIWYLMILFVVMLTDHYLLPATAMGS